MSLEVQRAIWIASEAGSYGVDPSSDGSGYFACPTEVIGDLQPGRVHIPTSHMTGRQFGTAPILGRDGWSISGIEVPLYGFTTPGGDGGSAPTIDVIDELIEHFTGTALAETGEGVGDSSTTSSLIADAHFTVAQQLLPVYEAGLLTPNRTQWTRVTVVVGGGTYTVSPVFAAAPTTDAIIYATRSWTWSTLGGDSLAMVYRQPVDGGFQDYVLLGGRMTKAAFVLPNGVDDFWRLRFDLSGDSMTASGTTNSPGKGSLPAQVHVPLTPLKGLLSPVWFAGSQIETRSIEIDFGLGSAEVASTAASNGRADYEGRTPTPTVKIEPLYTDGLQDLYMDLTRGEMMIQLGSGVHDGTTLNAMAVHLQDVHCSSFSPAGDGGRQRASMTFSCNDSLLVAGASSRYLQIARA